MAAKGGTEVSLRLGDGTETEYRPRGTDDPLRDGGPDLPGSHDPRERTPRRHRVPGYRLRLAVVEPALGGYYITNITDPWVPYTAVIEMSAFVDRGEFGGKSLVYLPKYLASDDASFEIPDDEWERRFVEALMRMYPDLRESDILSFKLSRERFVYALPTLGYSSRLAPRKTSVPGVWIVNSAHIVNGTLNVNETVKLAEASVRDLLAHDDRR